MNRNLTLKVKEYALDLGADLVGIAPIERFVNAPIMMSPQGLMPTAKKCHSMRNSSSGCSN